MTSNDKLSTIMVGVSGEYFVAAELSRRGYTATITLRNIKGIDILAANSDASRSVGIQVKTNRGSEKSWIMNKKAEDISTSNLFYIFVNLHGGDGIPSFYIVPSKAVAKYVSTSHKKWLGTPGKQGRKHVDTTMRKFGDPKDEYLGRWDLLKLED